MFVSKRRTQRTQQNKVFKPKREQIFVLGRRSENNPEGAEHVKGAIKGGGLSHRADADGHGRIHPQVQQVVGSPEALNAGCLRGGGVGWRGVPEQIIKYACLCRKQKTTVTPGNPEQ